LAAASGLTANAGAAAPVVCGTNHWVATWTADPSGTVGPALSNQTLRVGGDTLRIHLSNAYGKAAVTFAHVGLAIRLGSAAVIDNSQRQVTFGGQQSVSVPVGGEAISDPVTLTFAPFQDLAVSLFLASPTGSATGHLIARERSYATPAGSGDHTSDLTGNSFTLGSTSASFVDAVDTLAPANVSAAVMFGDSITDGYESGGGSGEEQGGIDLNHRYPDYLQQLILSTPGAPLISVVNAGISGNRVLVDGQLGSSGASGLDRLNSDVIGVAGVSDAIVLEGINDIALLASAQQMETALTQIVNRLHAYGIRVMIGTITPAGTGLLNLGSLLPSIFIDSSANAVRVAVNGWIRSGASGADGAVVEQGARGAGGHLLDRLADRGHRRAGTHGHEAVVEADHRQFARNRDAAFTGRDDRAGHQQHQQNAAAAPRRFVGGDRRRRRIDVRFGGHANGRSLSA